MGSRWKFASKVLKKGKKNSNNGVALLEKRKVAFIKLSSLKRNGLCCSCNHGRTPTSFEKFVFELHLQSRSQKESPCSEESISAHCMDVRVIARAKIVSFSLDMIKITKQLHFPAIFAADRRAAARAPKEAKFKSTLRRKFLVILINI